MKKLTYSSMAAARLRANKRQYLSLVLGIFLSIFMVSTLVLSIYGIYQAELQKRYDKVGYLDMVMMEGASVSDQEIRSFKEFDRFGHAYISGVVTDRNVYVGYYDETGLELMNLNPLEGRLPNAPGEIALEKTAMDILEVAWQVGDTVTLDISPVDGTAESRSYTVVGILPERSVYLGISDHRGISQFPAIITASQEPVFAVGRVAAHHLMGLSKFATLDRAILALWERYRSGGGVVGNFYGLSTTGEQRQYAGLGGILESDKEMFALMTLAGTLGVSLILSCAVGIAGAMEGILSKRQEEIGVLRALGATRRQIRRMFSRENLILALTVSPVSLLISVGVMWVLSLLLPGSLKFAVNLWLLLPVGAFSVTVILISGYLPLARASKLMPMSVIRDTAMLRRSKGVKSQKKFSAARLIASRQVRFNPTRQLGALLLVVLTLLCSGLLIGSIVSYSASTFGNMEAFAINASSSWHSDGHIGLTVTDSLSKQSLAQIRGLNHVKYITMDRHMTVSVLLDHVPRYVFADFGDSQFGMLDDEQFEEAMEYQGSSSDYWRNNREESRAAYLKFLKDYGIPGEAYRTTIASLELDDDTLDKLQSYVTSGRIDVEAIHAGTEVIVVAPEKWIKANPNSAGILSWYTEAAMKNDVDGEGAVLAAWNDTFEAGESLSLLQLYRREEDGPVSRVDATPTIGAVLYWDGGLVRSHMSDTVIITSEQGLENMGFPMEGLWRVEVYLEGDISLEEEELLETQLDAIARRNEGYRVDNYLALYRQRQAAKRQEILLYSAVAIVFFSVSVGMIVSSVTRQLNSEGKTIGMLRAVGADEKAILGCYSGRVHASVLGGMGICLGLILLALLTGILSKGYLAIGDWKLMAFMGATIALLGLLCLVICRFLLRLRIREIVKKSIIENIREL